MSPKEAEGLVDLCAWKSEERIEKWKAAISWAKVKLTWHNSCLIKREKNTTKKAKRKIEAEEECFQNSLLPNPTGPNRSVNCQ